MERLTFDGDFCDIAQCFETRGGSFCEDGACSQRKVWERLKRYEDTGLSPEDVIGQNLLCEGICEALDMENAGLVDLRRISKLVQADRDGRLVMLSKGDAEFLAKLRHELLTQPTDGNRDPRFWGVIDEVIESGYCEESADGWGVWDTEQCCQIGDYDDVQSLLDELTDPDGYAFDPVDFYETERSPEEIVDQANDLCGRYPFSVFYYKKSGRYRRITCF